MGLLNIRQVMAQCPLLPLLRASIDDVGAHCYTRSAVPGGGLAKANRVRIDCDGVQRLR